MGTQFCSCDLNELDEDTKVESNVKSGEPNESSEDGFVKCMINFSPQRSKQAAALEFSIQLLICDKILYLTIECIGRACKESSKTVFVAISVLVIVFISFVLSDPRRYRRSLEELFSSTRCTWDVSIRRI